MEPLNIISLKQFIQVGKKVGHQSNLLEYEHIAKKKRKETCPQIQFESISKVTLGRRKRKLLIQGVRHFRCLPYIIIIHTKDREKERKRVEATRNSNQLLSVWGNYIKPLFHLFMMFDHIIIIIMPCRHETTILSLQETSRSCSSLHIGRYQPDVAEKEIKTQ